MSTGQSNSASISLRRPSFQGVSPVLMEGRRPVTELNPNRVRVLRKQAKAHFAAAREFATQARPFLARHPTDPASYDFERAESLVLEMQLQREDAHRILRTLRTAKIVDGRGQRWGGSSGRAFRDDAGEPLETKP